MNRFPSLASVFAAAALAAGGARADWSPVGFSLFGQSPDPGSDVYGLRIGTFAHHRHFVGVSLMLFGNSIDADIFTDQSERDESADGVQIGFINATGKTHAFLIQAGFGNVRGGGGLGIQAAALGNLAGPGWNVQASMIGNVAGNADEGGFAVQATLFMNGLEGCGISAAGFHNHSEHWFAGIEAAPFNWAEEAAMGMQIGLLNRADESACGLQIGGWNNAGDAYGMQLGGLNVADDSAFGLQLGVLDFAGESANCQIGCVNWAAAVSGVQIGAINATEAANGVQIGGVNWSDSVSGLQLGAANFAWEDCSGVQIGAVNLAERLHGLQIGVFNAALSGCQGAQIGLFNAYAGTRPDISAIQLGGLNMAGGSAMFALPVLRVVF